MKNILTHIVIFIAGLVVGFIALPVFLFITFTSAPEAIPNFISKIASRSGNVEHGLAALKKAKTEEERFYHLGPAAKELFNDGKLPEAKKCSEELASLTPKHKGNWNYGNAIQDANLVLGRIAVRDGNIELAKSYLMESSKSPGSPQMDSFGPNVSLAKDLLEKGEKDAVIKYFEACKKFWKMGQERLGDWIALTKAGRVPDFGSTEHSKKDSHTTLIRQSAKSEAAPRYVMAFWIQSELPFK